MIWHVSIQYNNTIKMNVQKTKTLNIIQIQDITIQNTRVMYKYTCTLIYNTPVI